VLTIHHSPSGAALFPSIVTSLQYRIAMAWPPTTSQLSPQRTTRIIMANHSFVGYGDLIGFHLSVW